MKKNLLTSQSLFLISISVILIDQLSKLWIIQTISEQKSIVIIPNFINFRLVKNTGAAFSLLQNSTNFLGIISLAVSFGLIFWIWRSKRFPVFNGLGFSFLLGGCIGNGLDRWFLGYVNDFIELIPINFPIFNGADIAINLAVFCFLIESMRRKNDQHNHT